MPQMLGSRDDLETAQKPDIIGQREIPDKEVSIVTIEIGKYSRAGWNLTMKCPKARRVNGRNYDYKVKILGDRDDPVPITEAQSEIRIDLGNSNIKLIPTSSRGGRIVV